MKKYVTSLFFGKVYVEDYANYRSIPADFSSLRLYRSWFNAVLF